ncbi:3-keto-disaccharide hydrolase [Marinobacterium sedimentorum]|uniref:3-keto-disaccharide hydrolase n=1 Tax=Marinobacterium sedimentorum TaxID=2927804 RepID=UPI0020C745C9|nr:DUF1080 domain-containing protein [Marinobacterium sedimentorum]MCP8688336.1 DUF1080 domain-containing protein [Marinobacterium sedimentorum]
MNKIACTLLTMVMLAIPAMSKADTRQLFNGHDLAGWKHVGDGRFVVEDGLLHPEGGVGLLWFEGEKVSDAVVRVVYMVRARTDNSGVFVRIPDPPESQWIPVDTALEVQINEAEESDYYRTGSIYTFSKAVSRPGRIGEWNTMEITLDGLRTVVHINDALVADYNEGDPVPPKKNTWDPERGPRPESGYVALQNHPHGNSVYFREVSIHSIDK